MAVTNNVRMPKNKAETENDYLITTTVLRVIIPWNLDAKEMKTKLTLR